METSQKEYVQRFTIFPRLLHFLVIISFLTLAVTGMALKFAAQDWAGTVADIFGSFRVLGVLHRICAVITFTYFGLTLILIVQNFNKAGKSILEFVTDSVYSLVPMPNDAVEMIQTFKWFFGRGPQPRYGRWTYWEKFDFMAVFWGVAVIGGTGLCLWFPEWFTKFIPGYWINIATIIHSDEALLASGFIFTIHFFNTHLRPEKFPMDPVIFTGVMPLDELKHERPREYEHLIATDKLDEIRCEPPPKWLFITSHIFGLSALLIGLALVVSIIYSMIFLYVMH
jgi:cytochrome b subunit of formate dehydrogenase